MSRSVLLSAMTAVCVAICPAHAESGASDTAAAKLFVATCLRYPDNPARLRVLLDTSLTRAEDSNEHFFLGQRPGKVWFSRQPHGNLAVLALDDGRCAVDADTATAEGAMSALEGTAANAGYKVSTVNDDPKGRFHGVAGHVREYRLEKLGHTYPVKVSGTALPGALLHAELMLGDKP